MCCNALVVVFHCTSLKTYMIDNYTHYQTPLCPLMRPTALQFFSLHFPYKFFSLTEFLVNGVFICICSQTRASRSRITFVFCLLIAVLNITIDLSICECVCSAFKCMMCCLDDIGYLLQRTIHRNYYQFFLPHRRKTNFIAVCVSVCFIFSL